MVGDSGGADAGGWDGCNGVVHGMSYPKVLCK